MSKKKQTSIEFLQEALEQSVLTHEQIMQSIGLFEQAKEMRDKEIQGALNLTTNAIKNKAIARALESYAELQIQDNKIPTTMKLSNEFQPIREWAGEKGIISKGDMKSQFLKLVEEVGELSNGIQKQNDDEIKDAIGDCVVVLTNLAAIHGGFSIEECVNSAYEVISKRKGEMKDGVFLKQTEAPNEQPLKHNHNQHVADWIIGEVSKFQLRVFGHGEIPVNVLSDAKQRHEHEFCEAVLEFMNDIHPFGKGDRELLMQPIKEFYDKKWK